MSCTSYLGFLEGLPWGRRILLGTEWLQSVSADAACRLRSNCYAWLLPDRKLWLLHPSLSW